MRYGPLILEGLKGATTGRNVTMDCPACGKHTLSAVRTDTGAVLWHCWRGDCGEKGIHCDLSMFNRVDPAPYLGPAYTGAPDNEVYNPDYAFTVLRNFHGDAIGEQTRIDLDNGKKRVRTYPLGPGPMYDYHAGDFDSSTGHSLWLVEDSRSARRLAEEGQDAVAILGTNPSEDLYKTLMEHIELSGRSRVIVALDPDAPHMALRLRDRIGRRAYCLMIPVDIKDMPPDMLERYINFTKAL